MIIYNFCFFWSRSFVNEVDIVRILSRLKQNVSTMVHNENKCVSKNLIYELSRATP